MPEHRRAALGAVRALNGLGLELPAVTPPAGAYASALRLGDLVYTSGQLPMVAGELVATGAVGDGGNTVALAQEAARVAVLNAVAAAAEVAGGIEGIGRIVKTTVFVSSKPTFYGQPAVADASSQLLLEIFGDEGRHVRSAVGVAALPLNAPVEVELVAVVGGGQ